MRVLLVLVALLAAPLGVSVAQDGGSSANAPAWGRTGERGRGHDAAHCAARAERHPGKEINKCEPLVPPPPPPPPAGTGEISGKVYHNIDGRPGLAGWVVTLSGDVTASAVTDEFGRYAFTALPAGNHWVCLVVQDGWVQQQPTLPAPCVNGMGYTLTLAEGDAYPWAHFAMVTQ
ncbi:MAG TPA: hypothetical protein VFU41_13590 [Gemmatimonadales bacterium]|nr:hypothetical protein [Gemmatimonadales bacterium]